MATLVRPSKATINDLMVAPTSELLATASEVVGQQTGDSQIFDSALESRIPKFNLKEIQVGKILGRGGFCVVSEVGRIKTSDTETNSVCSKSSISSAIRRMMKGKSSKRRGRGERADSFTSGASTNITGTDFAVDRLYEGFDSKFTRDFVAKNAKKKKRRGGRYVLKQLAPEFKEHDKIMFLKGTVDLAMEAKYLSALEHPNIIEICGISEGGPFEAGFFLILEKVTETLSRRIKKWMDIDRTCKGITGVFVGSKEKILDLRRQRYETSYSICSGALYLHQKNIIFRDLKPDNIGFDANGTLKIFDFGLAKELKKADMTKDGMYRLTGYTGAPRYMAPEVGLNKPYNLSADVYSWSMIMWFILALEPPFGFYTEDMIADRVFKRGSRPAIFASWPETVGSIMKRAWDADNTARPSFMEISLILKNEIIESEPTVASTIGGGSIGSYHESSD